MSDELKHKILAAAARVLTRKGIAGSTMNDMAAEAGLTKGGLFYYFSGKMEVILCCIKRYEDRVAVARDRILRELPDRPVSYLRASILAMLEQLHNAREARSYIGGLFDYPDLRDVIIESRTKQYEDILKVYPHPDRIAFSLFLFDGLWLNSVMDTTVFYDGCIHDMEEKLLQYLDSIDSDCEPEDTPTSMPA